MNLALLVTLACCLAVVRSPDPPNLVANPGFEMIDAKGGPTDWKTDPQGMQNVMFARDTEVRRSGAASVRITIPTADNPGWPAYISLIPVKAGMHFQISTWMKTRDVARSAYVAIEMLDASGNRLSVINGPQATGSTPDWLQKKITAVVPTNVVTMGIHLILYGSGAAWFDDVEVTRDEKAEQLFSQLAQPLPAPMLARATVSEGDPARFQRLFQAAESGGNYVIGVIGGSITQGASASSPDAHYSAYVVRWMANHFPKAKFTLVNAGIGATGTNYGCLRCERDLLSKQPDLVVVEFAVNDGDTPDFAETYEGVVRQILASPKHPAVMQLFFMNKVGGNSQASEINIGSRYQLPMVSYRDMLWPEIQQNRLAWTDISPDEVHPNDLGHGYAGKLCCTVLDRALAGMPQASIAAPGALPTAALTDAYQYTALQEADALKPALNNGWRFDAGKYGYDKGWMSSTPGSLIEFEVNGQFLFLSYWRIRGAMGKAKVTIDGGAPTIEDGWFDQTWGGYRNMIRLNAGKPGTHRVRLELLQEKSEGSTGNEFRLLCLGAGEVK